MKETPIYATLMYDVRTQLDISWNEYVYLDMVQKLTIKQRWCSKSLVNTAKDLGMTKQGIMNMRQRLIVKNLIEVNAKGHPKVTDKYTGVAVNKLYHSDNQTVNKVDKTVNKLYRSGKQTLPKNNNRITKIKEVDKKEMNKATEESLKKFHQMRASLGI